MAPLTALCVPQAGERWDGFWSSNGNVYYARCLQPDGHTVWYAMRDSAPVRYELPERLRRDPIGARLARRSANPGPR